MSKKGEPEVTEEDWKKLEDEMDMCSNTSFKYLNDMLTLVAKINLPPTYKPQEILVNYGGLKSYWIPFVMQHPDKVPESIHHIVEWLIHSDKCNWAEKQHHDRGHIG